jgi:hypothetical protein
VFSFKFEKGCSDAALFLFIKMFYICQKNKMKKLIIFALLLTSCRTSQQLIEKAERRDPSILGQFATTIEKPRIVNDTIWNETRDTFNLIQRIEYYDTIYQVQYIHAKGKYDYKIERDQLRHDLKIARIENKTLRTNIRQSERSNRKEIVQENKTERTTVRKENKRAFKFISIAWIFVLFIGFVLLFRFFLKK